MPAIVAVVILGLLAVFQLALVLGAPIGHLAWGGQNRVLPRKLRISSAVSIVLYGIIAVVLLERAGLTHLFDLPLVEQIAAWVVTAYFVLGVPLNAISRSKPERFVMTPVVLVLAVLSLLVALG
jgi:hypothetical protein